MRRSREPYTWLGAPAPRDLSPLDFLRLANRRDGFARVAKIAWQWQTGGICLHVPVAVAVDAR